MAHARSAPRQGLDTSDDKRQVDCTYRLDCKLLLFHRQGCICMVRPKAIGAASPGDERADRVIAFQNQEIRVDRLMSLFVGALVLVHFAVP